MKTPAPMLRRVSVFGTSNVFKIEFLLFMILKDVHLWSLTQYNFEQEHSCQVQPGIFYPNYERHLPELDVLNETASPKAQTGFSIRIWDIKCVQNRILIVHDIERCAPVIFDAIQFWSGKHLSSKTRHCLFKLWMPSTWVWGTKWRHQPLRSNRFQYLGV